MSGVTRPMSEPYSGPGPHSVTGKPAFRPLNVRRPGRGVHKTPIGVDAVAGGMNGSWKGAHVRLEREISSLLSCWDPNIVERLDAVLVDCAAEALRLRAECVRVEQRLDAALEVGVGLDPASQHPRDLNLRRKQLISHLCRLEGLMGSLRLHRDRVAPLRASRR
jgi:hypothetical protein